MLKTPYEKITSRYPAIRGGWGSNQTDCWIYPPTEHCVYNMHVRACARFGAVSACKFNRIEIVPCPRWGMRNNLWMIYNYHNKYEYFKEKKYFYRVTIFLYLHGCVEEKNTIVPKQWSKRRQITNNTNWRTLNYGAIWYTRYRSIHPGVRTAHTRKYVSEEGWRLASSRRWLQPRPQQ